jgi:adenylylsulfate kinase-like enzyme
VRCPRDVCAERDPKGLYAQAAAGAISNLPGMDIPYEPPRAPEAIIDTDRTTVEAGVAEILTALPFLVGEQ